MELRRKAYDMLLRWNPYTIRLLANRLIVEKAKTPGPDGKNYLLMNLPYYLACKIPQYINWFISNHT